MLNRRSLQDIVAAAAAGILLSAAFPGWNLEALAWIAFLPLFYALEGKKPGKAFFLGFVSGLFFFFISLRWIIPTIVTYGKIPWFVGFAAFLLMTLILSVYPGIFAWGINRALPRIPLPREITVPLLWTGLEFLRGHFFIPFPWLDLGYSQFQNLPLIQISDTASVYGVTFLILMVNRALYEILAVFIFHGKEEKPGSAFHWRRSAGVFSVLIIVLLYGTFRLSAPALPAQKVRVAVVQGNIDQDRKWDESFRMEILKIYEGLTDESSKQHPDLILWPETAAPFIYEKDSRYKDELNRYVRSLHVPLLTGAPSYIRGPEGVSWFNSAYLINADGIPDGRYDKINLVPFGEYVPFREILFFVNKLTEGIGDFRSGDRHTVFAIPGHSFGTLICFEVIFPELFRQFVAEGAGFMTTITNDAWFGRSAAPEQHFSMVVFRAVENRTPVARAANTGISGFIDSRGRVLKTSGLFEPSWLIEELEYYGEKTVYTRFGDLFGWTNLVLTFIILATPLLLKRKKND